MRFVHNVRFHIPHWASLEKPHQKIGWGALGLALVATCASPMFAGVVAGTCGTIVIVKKCLLSCRKTSEPPPVDEDYLDTIFGEDAHKPYQISESDRIPILEKLRLWEEYVGSLAPSKNLVNQLYKKITFTPAGSEFGSLRFSVERRIMALADCEARARGGQKKAIYYFNTLSKSRLKFIQESIPSNDGLRTACDYFVFQNEPWYQAMRTKDLYQDFLMGTLLNSKVLPYLIEQQKYTLVETPRQGDIVIYFTREDSLQNQTEENPPIPTHFGRVTSVDNNGDVFVRSKFGGQYLYEHSLELVYPSYGNEYVFLRR